MNDFVDGINLVMFLIDHLAMRLQNVTAISSEIIGRWNSSHLNLEK